MSKKPFSLHKLDSSDILVNAKMWPFTMNGDSSNSTTKNTFFNRIGVKLGHHRVTIAPLQVLVDSEVSYSWRKKRDIILGEYTVAIQAKGLVTISRGNDIVMNIQRLIWKDHPTHFDFFLVKGEGFSNRIHGIVGKCSFFRKFNGSYYNGFPLYSKKVFCDWAGRRGEWV